MGIKKELEEAAQRNLIEFQKQLLEYKNKKLLINENQFSEKMKMKRMKYKLEVMRNFRELNKKKKQNK